MTDETDETFDYNRVLTNEDGSGIFSLKFSNKEFANSFEQKVASAQTEPSSSGSSITPSGSDGPQKVSEEAGPVTRANDTMTFIGSNGMEALSLDSHEVSKAINRVADETFRKDFPILQPKVEDANEEERERAKRMFTSVNDSGQSLHGLLKMVLQDHARVGTGMVIVRKNYTALDGEVVDVETDELVRGDPKKVRPVTDEMNQIGGLWACPLHRDEVHESAQVCECGVPCREVTYAKTETTDGDVIEDVFFDSEIIDFSFYNTRLQGRDGLSPVANIWKQAHILNQMRNWTGKFFDDDTGNRYPDRLLFVTTSNADAFEKRAQEAKDNRQESPYEEGIIFQENGELDVQKVDMMSSDLMGQKPEIKEEYKSDIRSAFGLVDEVDSANDQGGLAKGSKQMDVMSRSIQALRTDIEREVLPELEAIFGLEEWELTFQEEQEDEEKMTGLEKAKQARHLTEAGVPFRVENGDIKMVDTDDPIEADSEETENVNSEGDDLQL